MNPRYDLVIAGAGPAGMAAARIACDAGLTVLIVDDRPSAGGQVYRAAACGPLAKSEIFDADYHAAGRRIASFAQVGTDYLPSACMLHVSRSLDVTIESEDSVRIVRARAVLLAAGAMERPVAIPGWTLPGVMTAGAAQIALKSSGLVAEDAVFAGSGPLLYLVVAQYLKTGTRVRAVLDSTPAANRWRAALRLPRALLATHALLKGLRWLREIQASGAEVHTGVRRIRADGRHRLQCVRATLRDGRELTFDTPHLFLHEGVVPNINLALAAGCEAAWDEAQRCWRIAADAWGETSVPGIFTAGDASRVLGADAAPASGELAAMAVAHRLGACTAARREALARPARQILFRAAALRPFLDALFDGRGLAGREVDSDTVACRCEGVTFGEMATSARTGPPHVDAVKSVCRAGMGPCQGRLCSPTLGTAVASARPIQEGVDGPLRARFPVRPVTIGALADLVEEGRAS